MFLLTIPKNFGKPYRPLIIPKNSGILKEIIYKKQVKGMSEADA